MPLDLDFVIAAILLALGSGLASLVLPRASSFAQGLSAFLMLCSMLAGLAGAALRLIAGAIAAGAASVAGAAAAGADSIAFLPWQAAGGSLLSLDALSAFFLVPVFLVGGLGSVYGLGYWPRSGHPVNGRRLEVFWGLLVAGLGLLLVARQAMAFILGWELMALSGFFLVTTEDFRAESRRAGLVYLVGTHLGTLALLGFFALWRHATGSLLLEVPAGGPMDPGTVNALYLLALLGFGLKAGAMPLHFWLPGAHASAPSQVSAMLSGVVLKMGIYGLLRVFVLIEEPPVAWGVVVLATGATSGLLGVLFAIGQHDLKRLLAYHSVENIGIILMGLGLAMVGRSGGNAALVVLGLGGCLLHVWNHALFKSILFLGAGSVLHATHTREIDRLGGLAKAMPWTSATFLLGAVAISGLPPLNGFVSELLVLLGMFGVIGMDGAAGAGAGTAAGLLAAPVLAAIGALALACFVKVYGTVFLGEPRTRAAAGAHEAPPAMIIPMLILSACCVLVGLAPALVAPLLDGVLAGMWPAASPALPRLADLAPLGKVGALAVALVLASCLLAAVFLLPARAARRPVTWDCGYAAPTARMQYTAASFARSIVGLFSFVLRPREARTPVEGLFPGAAAVSSHVDDPVLDRTLVPAFRGLERLSGWFRRFQQGMAQDYILFIIITVMVLLASLLPVGEMLSRVFTR